MRDFMSYGRFKGGQHFSKKALDAGIESISPEQVKRLIKYGLIDFDLSKLTYSQAAHLLKELRRDKKSVMERIRTL